MDQTIKATFKTKHGLKADIHKLDERVFALTDDTSEIFIGSSSGPIQLAKQEDLDETNVNVTFLQNDVNTKNNARIQDIADTNTRVNTIVGDAGNSNTEIVDARGEFPLLRNRLDDVTTQLAQKASQSDVRLKAVPLEQTDLSDTLKQQIAGTASINAVPAVNSINTQQLMDGIVTKNKLVTPTTIVNIFDPVYKQVPNIIDNSYIDGSGNVQTLSGYYISGSISISGGKQYTIGDIDASQAYVGAWYDANGSWISTFTRSASQMVLTAPSNATALKLMINKTAPINNVLASGFYAVYTENVAPSAITNDKLNKNAIRTELYDKTKVTSGYYVGATGDLVVTTGIAVSDFIPVTPGVSYDYYNTNRNGQGFAYAGYYYDVNKSPLSGVSGGTDKLTITTTAPTNAAFFRFNIDTNLLDSAYFHTTNSTQYDIQWLKVKNQNYDAKSITLDKFDDTVIQSINNSGGSVNKWAGKVANFLGDSITYGYSLSDPSTQSYAALVKVDLSLATANNYGVSGTRITTVNNDTASFVNRYSSMADNADIVFVLGGTNDYGHTTTQNALFVPFGTPSDRTDGTFYGALHVLYEGLLNKYLGKTIVIITPLHRVAPGGVTGDDYQANPDTGKILLDYVNAEREVAEFYGIKVLDLFKNLPVKPSITAIKNAYLPDGLHPNSAGHRLIANEIISFMKNL